MRSRPWEERLYTALLRIYPEAFRRDHGADALDLFRDRLRAARLRRRRMPFLVASVVNVVVHGTLERAAEARGRGPAGGSAVRGLVRRPAATALLVATLALGVGGTTALAGLVRAVLFRPPPFPEPHELVRLYEENPGQDLREVGPSPGNLQDWQAADVGIEEMAGWFLTSGTFRDDGRAEELRLAQTTDGFFRTLGVEAATGRTFARNQVAGEGRAVVLAHATWTRLFDGDPGVVGRTVQLSGQPYTVLGVMPAGFAFPDPSVDAWIAWDFDLGYARLPSVPRTFRFLTVVGRMADGQDRASVQDRLRTVHRRLAQDFPEENGGWTVSVVDLQADRVRAVASPLWIGMAGAGLILLVSMVNVALLLLARLPVRRRELALRASLGATRRDVAGLLVRESAVVATLGAAAGLALAAGILAVARSLARGVLPGADQAVVDPGLALLATAVAFGATAALSVAPVLEATRGRPATVLRAADGRVAGHGDGLRGAFAVVQIAAAVTLLGSSALLGSALWTALARDPGFATDHVLTFRVSPDLPADDREAATIRYYDRFLEALEAKPWVASASAVQALPLQTVTNDFTRPHRLPGSALESSRAPQVQMRIVDPGYFSTLSVALREGDGFPGTEEPDGPRLVVVNDRVAHRLWGEGPAVGRTLELDFREGWTPYRVVGVVPATRHYGLQQPVRDEVFLSRRQVPYLAMSLVVRTIGPPGGREQDVRRIAAAQDPPQPVHAFATMDELLAASWARERLLLVTLGLFAALALALTVSGVYGVVSLSANQRMQEMGIRMAVGARPGQIGRMVLVRATVLAAWGTAAGVGTTLLASYLVRGVLADPPPEVPWATPVAAALMMLAALGAAAVPAVRAARWDVRRLLT